MENSQNDGSALERIVLCNRNVCTVSPVKDSGDRQSDEIVDTEVVKITELTDSTEESESHVNTKNKASTAPLFQKIHSQQDLDRFKTSNDVLLVEFVTSWCGACKGIAERLKELSAAHADTISVCQVYCDSRNKETKKLVASIGITSYPVFVVYSDGLQVQKWNGADVGKLEGVFEKYGDSGGGAKGSKSRKKKGRK